MLNRLFLFISFTSLVFASSLALAQSRAGGMVYDVATTYNYSRFERLTTGQSTNFLSRSGYGAAINIERTGQKWGFFVDGTFDSYSFEPPQGVTVESKNFSAQRYGIGLLRKMGLSYTPYLAIDYDGVIFVGETGTSLYSVETQNVVKARVGIRIDVSSGRGPGMAVNIYYQTPITTVTFEDETLSAYNVVGANLKLQWGRTFKSGFIFGFQAEEYKAAANYFTTLLSSGLFMTF